MVDFNDFSFVLEEECIGLNFTKQMQIRMFTFIDRDKDGALHLKDFVKTIQEV